MTDAEFGVYITKLKAFTGPRTPGSPEHAELPPTDFVFRPGPWATFRWRWADSDRYRSAWSIDLKFDPVKGSAELMVQMTPSTLDVAAKFCFVAGQVLAFASEMEAEAKRLTEEHRS